MTTGVSALVLDRGHTSRSTIVQILRQDLKIKTIFETADRQHALAMTRQAANLGCILLDLDLPGCDGLELLKELKAIPGAINASVVAISASNDKQSLLKAAAAGVSDYIIKPFTANTLSAKLRKMANNASFRINERTSFLEGIEATISVGRINYPASLLDLSIGGCSLRTPIFDKGGSIYDIAKVSFLVNGEPLTMEATLLRMERDLEQIEKKRIIAGFQFLKLDKITSRRISCYIEQFKIRH